MKLLADGSQAEGDQEEIESIQHPTEESGGESSAVIRRGLGHRRGPRDVFGFEPDTDAQYSSRERAGLGIRD